MGDRYQNLKKGIDLLNDHPHIWVIDQSHIYQSPPMYYLEQDDFYNMVIQLQTNLTPIDLLNEIKSIVETENLIDVAKMLGISALKREESRGCHYRYDFPETDNDKWKANIIVSKNIATEEMKTKINQISR